MINFPGVSVIFGASIIGFWYWCTDQHIVQRALAAKNLTHARKGTILAGFLKVLPVFMFLIPGMIAAALRSQGKLLFTDNNEAYGSLVGALLPMGIKGYCGGRFYSRFDDLAGSPFQFISYPVHH